MEAAPGLRRVMVVDDDPALLHLVSQWLRDGGFTVVECSTFADAKRQLASSPPLDVLLTDVRLGAFNGLQLVILVKEQNPQTRTVVMSAYDDPALRREAARCGALYLLKPFSSEAVLDSVTAA